MGLLDDLQLPEKILSCKVRSTAEKLEKADAQIFLNAVMDVAWPIQTLELELQKRNITVSATSMRKHRAKTCSCWNH